MNHSILLHSLVNMVDSVDITLEKIKTQELSLEINTFSNTLLEDHVRGSFADCVLEPSRWEACILFEVSVFQFDFATNV